MPKRKITEMASDCSTKSDKDSSPVSEDKVSKQKENSSSRENKPPPTAVVVPVVHKQNVSKIPHQKEEHKRKISNNETENQTKKKKIEKKRVSPLNRSDDSVNSCSLGNENRKSSPVSNSSSSNASVESSVDIKDVEMKDVSLDLIDDLKAKKETVFDATACYYIVVDTNVLIRELHLINELKDTPLDGCGPPHIFIPWIVIEELDKLKNSRNKLPSRTGASEAIRYLNSVLSSHPRFHGQSPAEAEEWAKTYSKNNDDKILECCHALMHKMPSEKVILLTNDKNLVNKALIQEINVHNFESMMKKVKPDTKFNYEELKRNKKNKEKKPETESSVVISQDVALERRLHSDHDRFKCKIHSLMSNARLLLKDVLYLFLEAEMLSAYGEIWTQFPIERKLLKGILEGIKKYWRMVFSEFLTQKDLRNFELLLEKAQRPEGYFGDKDECLVILSTIEDIFRQVQKRHPSIKVSVETIKEYRITCVNYFTNYNEIENTVRIHEEKSVLQLFHDDWNCINQLIGLILDFYNVPNDFSYVKFNGLLPEPEVQRILITLLPAVQHIKTSMINLLDAVKDCKPTKTLSKRLYKALLEFIPSLQVPHETSTYPFFSSKALERFFLNKHKRETLEIGLRQIKKFDFTLDQVMYDLLKGSLTAATETMICD